jgi:glycyl-tRNA synthetase beta chain
MVQEFTELQGIVGGLYAKVQGEPEEVSTAIYDHYLPAGAEGDSPRTLVGAIVSLADKLDSVVAGFAAGYEPTGSSDPFALRRQANGIIKVLLDNKLALNLKEIVVNAIDVLDIQWRKPREEVVTRVLDFFAERLRFYFESVRHFRYDTVRAVVAAGAEQPADAQARAEAMEVLRGGEDFEALSAAAKRIRNILAKSATAADWQAGEVVSGLLTEPQEKDLADAYGRVAGEVERRRAAREYRRALEEISTLRPAVDRFFDKVLVMAENREVRQNRLRLLKKLDELFSGIAHFAEIAEKQ